MQKTAPGEAIEKQAGIVIQRFDVQIYTTGDGQLAVFM